MGASARMAQDRRRDPEGCLIGRLIPVMGFRPNPGAEAQNRVGYNPTPCPQQSQTLMRVKAEVQIDRIRHSGTVREASAPVAMFCRNSLIELFDD